MSRAYRISVSDSISTTVNAGDEVSTCIDILGILPLERTSQILAESLEKRGFTVKDDIATRKEDGSDVVITVDIKSHTVSAKVESTKKVEIERTSVGSVYEEQGTAERSEVKDRLAQNLKASLQKEVAAQQEKLRQEATAKLSGSLDNLRAELDKISNEVTVSALKERASQLGEIKEISEDPKSGSMTIKIKV